MLVQVFMVPIVMSITRNLRRTHRPSFAIRNNLSIVHRVAMLNNLNDLKWISYPLWPSQHSRVLDDLLFPRGHWDAGRERDDATRSRPAAISDPLAC
jgi:hypothetical protein